MKQTICTLIAIIVLLGITACSKATAEMPNYYAKQVVYVHDWSEPKEPNGMVRIVKEQQERAAQKEQEQSQEQAYEEYYEYVEPTYYAPSYTGDGFAFEGVREYNGRTETWYSSNQLYHKDTANWSVDDEGYYRTDEGYYVVAASDMPEGTVFETSKGQAQVLDGGCEDGVTDFYVAFG